MQYIALLLCGFAAGIASGMGLGGGNVLIPLLCLLVGVNQTSAQDANLISFAVSCPFSLFILAKNGLIKKRPLLLLLPSALLFSLLGCIILSKTDEKTVRIAFSAFLIASSMYSAVSAIITKKNSRIFKKPTKEA